MPLIKTNISTAFWCTSSGFEPAISPHLHDEEKKDRRNYFDFVEENDRTHEYISWFDHLFDGDGIETPSQQEKPIIMLFSGPPGSGKTTLALELCLRVAINHGFWSLYISTESETTQLEKKVKDLGIKDSIGRVVPFKKKIQRPDVLTIYGQENIKKWDTFSEIVRLAIEDVINWLTKERSKLVKNFLEKFRFEGKLVNISPDILVFDNLNMIKDEDRHDFFERIVKGKHGRTKLIIVVIDSHTNSRSHESWEFVCDNIIRLDYTVIKLDETSLRDYFIRNIEVIKARYQAHTWGKQQLKIYKPYKLPSPEDPQFTAKMRRAHPYRKEGGIFIYPSIHFYLSEYKRRGITLKIKQIPTPCAGLNEVIEGIPEGRCTALMGCRGGHKSHLGYLHILERILESNKSKEKEAGIIISLRDDEEMTRQHLLRILVERLIKREFGDKQPYKSQRKEFESVAEGILANILNENDLEILYYPPGYITADEFFHRMFMSVYRLRSEGRKTTLLFNSLDQISARFPLCAHQPIFVPAIIESLSGEKVTSIFIAVDEPGQPSTQYGLFPMADLILTFDRYKIRKEDYYKHHNQLEAYRKSQEGADENFLTAILLEVSRFAGGQQAGTRGLLELVYSDKKSDSLIKEPGLHFKKWNYEYKKQERTQ